MNFRLCVWWKSDSRARKKYCENDTRWKTTEDWKCKIVIKFENEIRTMKKNFTKKTNCFWWNELKTSKNSSFQLFTLMKLNIKAMKLLVINYDAGESSIASAIQSNILMKTVFWWCYLNGLYVSVFVDHMTEINYIQRYIHLNRVFI